MSTECGFSQIVDFATRGPNTLDLFFTSRPSLVQQYTPLPEISDHCAILTTMKRQQVTKFTFGNELHVTYRK